MNNIQVNSIDDIGFSNPNSNSNWNRVDGEKEVKPYFGQSDPNWRENAQEIIDEQEEEMKRLEDAQRKKSLPTEILIFGGGTLVILTILVIYKYVKK
tara:strand:- start:1821 stop:2111 length:291 start_codon:yes stop_codon:yes gene_type:complete